MAVRLAKRRNEELVSGNHIVLHKFMNFQGRAKNVVELVEKYDMGSFEIQTAECWLCMRPDGTKGIFTFGKINSFTMNDYKRFKSE